MRSLLTALAAAVGALVLLVVLAVVAAERAQAFGGWGAEPGMRLVRLAVVLSVAIPVLVLAATVGRLSASLRDRRLANLRLLGMGAAETRVVAAAEAGVGATIGAIAGALLFLVLRPLVADVGLAGRTWDPALLWPDTWAWPLVILGLPTAACAVAALPHRLDTATALDRARRRDVRRPGLWRLLPLAVGLAVSAYCWRFTDDGYLPDSQAYLLLGAVALTGIGVIIVVPVFVRLLADVTLRLSRGPVTLLAARRLQAQPAAVTRVVAVLMLGLFLVVGARAVLVAFEETPQYQNAARNIEVEQLVMAEAAPDEVSEAVDRARSVDGVRDVVAVVQLGGFTDSRDYQIDVVVGTCADMRRLLEDADWCSDAEATGFGHEWAGVASAVRLASADGLVVTPGHLEPDYWDVHNDLYADLFVPASLPGVEQLVAQHRRSLVVTADPGRDLMNQLEQARVLAYTSPSFEDYDFVAGLRAVIWTIAAVILAIGLLTFAVAAIDRALSRRREVASLQLLGASPSVLRRAQWLEGVLPIALGSVVAVAAGLFAGATWLQLGGEGSAPPWSQAIWLAVVSLAASVAAAGLTVVASNIRLSPEVIRQE